MVFRQDCDARGISYEQAMAGLFSSSKRFKFGDTVLPSLRIAPLWITAPDGRSEYVGWRHVVESITLLLLVGLYLFLATGATLDYEMRTFEVRAIGCVFPMTSGTDFHSYISQSVFRLGPQTTLMYCTAPVTNWKRPA